MNTQTKLTRCGGFAAVVLCLASLANAQTVEKKTLTLQGAEQVIAAAKAEAQKLQAPGGVIAVVDDGGNLMALERLDGTFSAGANISIGKAKTAVMFKKPTRFFEELINSSGKGRTVMTALENFTPLIGGIPMVVDGSATFIPGGDAVEAKEIGANELRGSSIRNGETRQIAKGDVIVVPNGVPHQFLKVTDPFLYYVVKVR